MLLFFNAASVRAETAFVHALSLSVPQSPTPVALEGRTLLIYELQVANFRPLPLSITALTVRDAANGRELASFSGEALRRRLRRVSGNAPASPTIPPSGLAVVYLEIELPDGRLPAAVMHRIECRSASGSDAFVIDGPAVVVERTPPVVLGPPLRGGPWVAVHQPDWDSGHRRVFYAIEGQARLPGRYAVDWVKVDATGRTARYDGDVPQNSFGYGAEVLAVADASVAETRDGLPESPSVAANPAHPLSEAAGNYIALRLADGRCVIYEHLRPGSLKVRPGETVRRGQVIAQLGFTGDTTGPHLHLHAADAPTPLRGDGLPFVFEEFNLLGHYRAIEHLGSQRWESSADPSVRKREYPGFNAVVQFPE